jgi:chromosomal replication initiator protein
MAEWDYEIFWKETLNQMREELGEQEFSRWFTLLEYREASENAVTLGVPSTFYREEIKRRYKSSIESKLKMIIERDVELIFEIVQQPLKKTPILSVLQTEETEKIDRKEEVELKDAGFSSPQNGKYEKNEKNERSTKRMEHPQLKAEYNFDSYVVGDNNSFAANAAMAIGRNPGTAYNPFFLYGGVGLGKTHLMQAIGNYMYKNAPDSKIIYITAESFLNEYVEAIGDKKMSLFKNKFRYADVLLMDDIHFLQDKAGVQEELFHTFNSLYESNKQVVFTCDRPASELKKISDRLRSRFERGLNVDLQPPNYETRYAILKKKAESKNIDIPDDVIALVSKNVSSNVRDLEAALTKLAAYADLAGKTVTVEIARQQLKDVFASPKQSNMSLDIIQRMVAEHFKITSNDLKGKKRSQNVAFPRQLAMYVSREITEYSTTEIGQAFGGRDHTTVMHSCNKIKERIQAEPELDSTIQSLIRIIKEYNAKI